MNMKKEYIDRFNEQLKIWDAKINRLQLESKHATGDVKQKYEEFIDDLLDKRNTMQEKLKQMLDADDEVWVNLKKGFEQSWDDMSDTMRRAATELFN